jgi:hypothetical protein
MQQICRICKKNMQNMSYQKTFQVYPKICKICNEYAKYVSQNLICRICTPHFADENIILQNATARCQFGARSENHFLLLRDTHWQCQSECLPVVCQCISGLAKFCGSENQFRPVMKNNPVNPVTRSESSSSYGYSRACGLPAARPGLRVCQCRSFTPEASSY